jgi:alpha-1,3-rhamnosyl/mannosyltransferase
MRIQLQDRLLPPRPKTTAAAPAPSERQSSWLRRYLGEIRRQSRFSLEGHFRHLIATRRYDVYHEPNFLPKPCDLPTVVTVHDLSVLNHPEWHPANRVASYSRDFERGLRQCSHIVTVSEFVRQEIIHTLGWSPERVTVTPNGVRPDLGPLPSAFVAQELRRLGLPPRYLLYLGTLEPRKNLLMLLRAYTSLPLETRTAFPLLLVGNWGWNTDELAAYYDKEARHKNVMHLGYVADEHLGTLYNGARALVFPSFYEGFGLPPVEMLACGGAVLASTAGALVETVGQQACLIDPHDQDGWHKALLRVTLDDAWWQSLRNDAVRAVASWTWENCAARTRGVYRQVLGLKPAEIPARQAG